MRLLGCQLVVAAATAGKVARTAELDLVPDLDAPGVVNALSMAASARLFPRSSGHTRMLSQRKRATRRGWGVAQRASLKATTVISSALPVFPAASRIACGTSEKCRPIVLCTAFFSAYIPNGVHAPSLISRRISPGLNC